VSVVAIGKAAPAMAAGVLARWHDVVSDVLVVTSDGTDTSAIDTDERVEILRAGHPLPDRRSVLAARHCLARAHAVRARAGLLVVLVSGGASALVCAPANGLRLRDKQAVTREMLASGASIQEINVVRRHLSRIKGGGLARAADPAPVVTLVLSDVIGGTLVDVGSGPAVSDATSVAHARRLLRRYAPRLGALPLVTTGGARNVRRARIVASPEELAREVARELRTRGLRARVLPPSQRPVAELAAEYGVLARRLHPGTAIVRAAEPSLEVPRGAGQGGRSTHLAALVALEIPRGATFLAAATDGVDGASRTGGAIVDRSLVVELGERAVRRALDRYDTGRLHRSAATALPLRPSGQNLADVHILTVSP
jgi:glycerate 2-kinase